MENSDNNNLYSKPERGSLSRKHRARRKAWRMIRSATIAIISMAICAIGVVLAKNYISEHFFMPVDSSDATPVTVVISSGAGASSIAKKLYEAGGVDEEGNIVKPGLISSKTVFKIYVDFMGKSGKLKAGTYILSRNMDVGQIVDVICAGNPPRATLKFVITEGMTVEQIAKKLVELGVTPTVDEFLMMCKTGEKYSDYAFVSDVIENMDPDRRYALEGYLFPDTYEIYSDESVKSVINRLVYRFSQIMTDEYIARAKELGMTVDQVLSMAALIEKEARVDGDFAKVSAVFHNRLNTGMKLQSDAPIQYIFNRTGSVEIASYMLNDPSPYNTHVHDGLPIAPICNPGLNAIRAALYPDEKTMEDGYYYFCLSDNENGALAFAKTLEEHNENIEKYKQYWK